MKNKLILSIIVITLGLGTLYFYFTKIDNGNKDKDTHEANSKKSEEKIYICPMHPQIKSDRPGTCPICGMDLVLMEYNEGNYNQDHSMNDKDNEWENVGSDSPEIMKVEPADHAQFSLSLDKQQIIGVKTTKAIKKNLFKTIRAPGRIAFDPELYTAQSEYLEALKQWKSIERSPIVAVKENTRQMIRSSTIRLRVLGLSDDQIKDLGKKGKQSEGLLLSGKGQENWVYADVFEMDLPYIEKGLSAQISANFLQGQVLPAKVVSVDQVINPATRTAKVRIQLLNKSKAIRPESYVNVTIFAPLGNHLSIPLEAILDTGKETYVFIQKGKGQYIPRKVKIVFETEDDVAIKNNIEVGDQVVIGGNFMLDSESRLKSVILESSNLSGHNH